MGRRHPIAAGIGAGLPTGSAPPRPPPSMSPTHANKLGVGPQGRLGAPLHPTIQGACELIERHVARVIVKPQALEVCLIPTCEVLAQGEGPSLQARLPSNISNKQLMRARRAMANAVAPEGLDLGAGTRAMLPASALRFCKIACDI
ncbi:MAG: hypothetical protein CR217_17510 [Beijerinckiaceae bacterium]|nr:MAG: hypothetical protein CR217_17510 [Beijerinckiaceae bacterium]